MEKKRRRSPSKRGGPSGKWRAAASTGSRLTRADLAALRQLDHLVEQRRRQEELAKQIPPEVVTDQFQFADGTHLFRFSHPGLGDLGQLRIAPVPAYMFPVGGCIVAVELFEDDPDRDPRWDDKYELLKTMVTVLTAALPREKTLQAPMDPLSRAKEQRRLYLRFAACTQTDDLVALAATLSDEQYDLLQHAIRQAQTTASPQDRAGLLQRQDALHWLFRERKDRTGDA